MEKKPSTKLFGAGQTLRIIKPVTDAEAGDESVGSQNAGSSALMTPERPSSGLENATDSPLSLTKAAGERLQTAVVADQSEHAPLAPTRNLRDRSVHSLRPLLEDVLQKSHHLMDAAAAGFVAEIEERLRYQASMTLANFDIEANARLTGHIDRAVGRIAECQRDSEQSLQALVTDSQKEVNQRSSQRMGDLQQSEMCAQGDFQKQAQSKLNELKMIGSEITGELLRLNETLAAELKSRTDQMIRRCESRMQVVVEKAAATVEQRIGELAPNSAKLIEEKIRSMVDRQLSGVVIQAFRMRLRQLEREFTEAQDGASEPGTASSPDGELPSKSRPSEARRHSAWWNSRCYGGS